MKLTKAVLRIPGDRSSARIMSVEDDLVYFDGNETQALRISFCLPRFVGGDVYTISEGTLYKCGTLTCFKIEDGAGLDNDVEIEFVDNVVKKVSVVWK